LNNYAPTHHKNLPSYSFMLLGMFCQSIVLIVKGDIIVIMLLCSRFSTMWMTT